LEKELTPMRRVIPISEQFQHFVEDVQGSFWSDCYGQARRFVNEAIERESVRLREAYLHCNRYERTAARCDQRNGFYYRDFQTRFGGLRLKIARSRTRSFLPAVIQLFQRRSEDVTLLVREAFLRGISTRQVGRVLSCLQLGALSAQTVSRLSRSLDSLVAAFHQARLADEWAYLFLDGVSLRVRRPAGRKRVQMLVAYGVRRDGSRQLLAFLRSQGESQAAWEGLLEDLYRRGLTGENLQLIVTDGCPGLAAAIPTVYPRALHQRCWVHKMRNLLEHVRRRDWPAVKNGAQAIYLATDRAAAVRAFRAFQARWQEAHPAVVRKLEQDLPDLLSFFAFPKHLWRKLRTTNVIERCFVEVRRRTRPMVCFVNELSVERIIYAIFHRFNEQWKNRTLRLFTQAA
jgi:putative transposase